VISQAKKSLKIAWVCDTLEALPASKTCHNVYTRIPGLEPGERHEGRAHFGSRYAGFTARLKSFLPLQPPQHAIGERFDSQEASSAHRIQSRYVRPASILRLDHRPSECVGGSFLDDFTHARLSCRHVSGSSGRRGPTLRRFRNRPIPRCSASKRRRTLQTG
jgi:hypothetical protein